MSCTKQVYKTDQPFTIQYTFNVGFCKTRPSYSKAVEDKSLHSVSEVPVVWKPG